MPRDYSEPFWIEGPVGNNALSYSRRGPTPKVWVPELVDGTWADVQAGVNVAFEDVDENDALQSCPGLARLIKTTWAGVPTVVVDNHNHAFYFWFEARMRGVLLPGATLIHIDQHRDTRVPDRLFEGERLEDAFDYTNFHLNVGNYIVPAQNAALVGETQFVTGEAALRDASLASRTNKILNLDLDFFAPEMAHVDFDLARRFIETHLPTASLITVATSPFFVGQERAIEVLRRLAG